jgi:NADH:ubiquinone oxidoreductase subunit E
VSAGANVPPSLPPIGDPRSDRGTGPVEGDGADGRPRHRRTTGAVPRFGHGSRVPGWDEAVDLSKPPATIPDPATISVPPGLREAIEAAMAKYPDRRSAVIPALHAAQQVHGWCSPEALAQVSAVMQLTPAYLTSVATFYDMFWVEPTPANDVFVCTNISCSLRGADEFFEAMKDAAADADDVYVRSFECLGACDIAPMASVNGEYVGPLTTEDARQIVEDLHAGRPVLEHKQLRYLRCADPGVEEAGIDFGPPDEMPKADTAGLGEGGDRVDRPGGTAPIEMRTEQAAEISSEDAEEQQDS